MQIYQPKDGYCYNSDTLFLWDFALPFLKKHKSVLEIGAGCGILSLLCGREIPLKLNLIEKNPQMVELCKQNLRINNISATLIEGDFLDSNILDSNRVESKFDFILSNPPFYNDGVIKSKKDSFYYARYALNLPFYELVKKANSLLAPQGEFIFCYDAKAISSVFSTLYSFKIPPIFVRFVYPKINKSASLLLCRAKKNSKSLCEILPPLFVHFNKDFSEEVKEIYKKAKTWSIKC
ncbi:MAG: methyltransferase [Helicobacteraceae bacterium]|nr:methyltransferase [Helicobacteraceae bacterium]